MITGITKSILEFLKLTPRYLVALSAACTFLLFSPENILKKLSIFNFTQNYRPWLSIVLILAFALLIVTIAIEITKWIKGWWRERKFYNRMTERLNGLTENEKQILRFYIAEQTKTNVLRIDDGIVQGLVSAASFIAQHPLAICLKGFLTTFVISRGIISMYICIFSKALQTHIGLTKEKDGTNSPTRRFTRHRERPRPRPASLLAALVSFIIMTIKQPW